MTNPDELIKKLIEEIKSRTKNIEWKFAVETNHWNYQVVITAGACLGDIDIDKFVIRRVITDSELERILDTSIVADRIVHSVTDMFRRSIFLYEPNSKWSLV